MRRIKTLPRRAALAVSRLAAALAVLVHAHAVLASIYFIGGDLISVAPEPGYMLAGDLTLDGLTDVIVVSPASREVDVFVASSDAPSHFAPARRLSFGNGLRGPALGDLNADGRLDLVVTDASAKAVWVLLGRGDGSFADPYEITVPNAPPAVPPPAYTTPCSCWPAAATADSSTGRSLRSRKRRWPWSPA